MTVLPSTLQYGKIVARFVLAVGDAEDEDRLPDAKPVQGTVTFTSLVPLSKETEADPPTTVIRQAVRCKFDSEGYLVDPMGVRGVWLVVGAWRVSYTLHGATIPQHDILVTADHTADDPANLINALPPGGPILSSSQYAELSARIDEVEVGRVTQNVIPVPEGVGYLRSLEDGTLVWDTISATVAEVDWGNVYNRPSTFPPAPHSHDITDVVGLQDALDATGSGSTDGYVQSVNGYTAGPDGDVVVMTPAPSPDLSPVAVARSGQVNIPPGTPPGTIVVQIPGHINYVRMAYLHVQQGADPLPIDLAPGTIVVRTA